ncbi:MAG: hypothetical protein M3Q69_07820 [Acidobacteriota bacterium]|nr:hypothetical protein [Acidobacteriota bacterium]
MLHKSLLALAVFAILLSGCSDEAVALPTTAPFATAPALPPLHVVVFVDQTTSMDGARVAPVMAAQFAPVYERLAISGGELAVGLVRDDSDRPFTRLFVPPPPNAPPVRPQPKNVFEAAAARKRDDAERARYAQVQRAWRSDITARQAVFARTVEPILAHPADAPSTDIWSALRRADVFLSEPNAFARPTRNVVILVSDGVETASRTAAPRLSAAAQIVLVNGAGEVGTLASLAPIRFESFDAAIRYAVADGGTHVRR